MPMQLTPEQLEAYHRQGYVVVEDLVSSVEVEALHNRLREYTHDGRPLGSIRVQIEPRVQRGELEVNHPGDAIRKVDSLVEGDELFRKLGLNENIVGIISQVLGSDIKMFRNALLMKPPEVGSQKGWHQDSPYWPIQPMNLCSCWFALDDATAENGCLAALSGWHKKGALPHVSVTDDFVIDEQYYDSSAGVIAPVKAGGGVFFHMSSKSQYTGKAKGPQYFHVKGETYPGCVR